MARLYWIFVHRIVPLRDELHIILQFIGYVALDLAIRGAAVETEKSPKLLLANVKKARVDQAQTTAALHEKVRLHV